MAVDDKGIKVGLALGGGAAKGMAHIGVLEVLQKEKIPLDMVAGTSIGSIIGALLARGMSAIEMKTLVQNWDWRQRIRMVDLTLPKSGFLNGSKITQFLKSIIGDISFDDLELPFACVATDINSGEEIVMNKGSVLEAVRASISLPIIFSVVQKKGRYLVDGGLVDPVPVAILREMGADFIIAVNVLPRLSNTRKRVYIEEETIATVPASSYEPRLFNIIMNTTGIPATEVIEDSLKGADIIIEPKVSDIKQADFHRAEDGVLAGGLAAIDAVSEIKRTLAALSQPKIA